MPRFPSIVIALLLMLVAVGGLHGQDADRDSEQDHAARWFDYYRQRAETDYEIVRGQDQTPLLLGEASILNWTNPLEDGQINGSTYLWELNGRPMVLGQLFSYLISDTERSYCHVFTSLTDEAIEARFKDKAFWKLPAADQSGWAAVPDGPTPAGNRIGRLVQMRRIAGMLEAHTLEDTRGKRVLRLLPQPLWRPADKNKDSDGGLFAYVIGNDPELLLLIEADLESESGWRWRFVQSTRSTTIATRDGVELYRYDGNDFDPTRADARYLSQHGVERIPANP